MDIDPPIPAAATAARAWPARALATLPRRPLTVLVLLCLVWTFEKTGISLVSLRDGQGLSDLANVAIEFAFHVALAVIIGLPLLGASRFGPDSGWRRMALFAATVAAVIAPAAALMRYALLRSQDYPDLPGLGAMFPRFYSRYAIAAGVLALIFELYRREVRSVQTMQRAEVDRLALEREMQQARLAVLQAQIEPHFLFNTLANVRRLYQTDLASGREMLEHLMRYLEVALPRMRDQHSTLGRELTLAESFLEVQRIRMGRRLNFAFDIGEALRGLELPPMMLLTLVENAIKHGLNPLPEGGFIGVRAERRGDRLRVEVADSGRGFQASAGGGTGLANIHARLAAQYGSAAGLELLENRPRGVTAVLHLPATMHAAR